MTKQKHIKGICFAKNYGKSQDLHAGFEAAKGTYVVTLDADLQDSPEEIPQMIDQLKEGAVVVGIMLPYRYPERVKKMRDRGITSFAMELVPRISRAQSMDVLSSQANIAGYRAVVEAAQHFGRFFTGQITAAGKVPPAKVMVIGAGVAGLAAIGAAGSLGADCGLSGGQPWD